MKHANATRAASSGASLQPPAGKQAEATSRKEAILTAAQEVFGQWGYSVTTMKMIAERAGVAFGLVAHHYGKKDQLFIQAGFAMVDALMKHVHARVEGAEDGMSAVVRYVNAYMEFTLAHRSTFPILIRCSPFSDVELPSEREAIAEKFTEIIHPLGELVERGIADGSISGELDPHQTAFLIYGSIVVTVRTLLITPYDVGGLHEEATRFVMRSLRPCERGEDRPCVFSKISLVD